jgi:glutamine amidotransferase
MIAVIDSCGSNLASLRYALNRLQTKAIFTTDSDTIKKADAVILPGVGHAQYGMQQLKKYGLVNLIPTLRQPVLGICLGMQLLYDYSEEGCTPCLGIIPSRIRRFNKAALLSIPHMGWNTLEFCSSHKNLNQTLGDNNFVYFVHSYYASVESWTVAKTHYGGEFSALVKYKNFIGMQFHPEKSSQVGARCLDLFLQQKL